MEGVLHTSWGPVTRVLAALVCTSWLLAEVPSPEEHFGHSMGEDRQLVGWSPVVEYFRLLDAASDMVRVEEIGQSTEGRMMIAAIIAEPGTIAELERYKQISQRLADPRQVAEDEVPDLVEEGKPIVAITCSIHSSEVASTMTAVQFAHDLVTRDSPRHRAILENTILLLMPSLNPDGVDMVRDWYDRWVGGPFEGAPLIRLYHRYTGHDLNRDWYIFSQRETRLVVEHIHNEWRPQVVYDVHEMGTKGARIFVPPWVDPIDPNIDPLIVQQVNAFGTAMAVDLTAAGKTGVLVNGIYDYFSPARHYQSYHGALRLLSESAGARFASPITVTPDQLETGGRNYNSVRRSWNFLEPWPGGEWRLADIVDYQLVAFESVLHTAAKRRHDLLRNFHKIGTRITERGRGRAFLVPRDQHDPHAAARMLRTLRSGDVEIERAMVDGVVADRDVLAGDYIVRLDQPYGAFANTLLSNDEFPVTEAYPGGPPVNPYDSTTHNLPLLMGVDVHPLGTEIEVETEPVEDIVLPAGSVDSAAVLSLSPNPGMAWLAVNRLLASGVPVHRDESDGAFLVGGDESVRSQLEDLARELGVVFGAREADISVHPRLEMPRVALYSGHVPIIDEGWTRWLLENYGVPYESVGNADLKGDLAARFDALILPDAAPELLAKGYRHSYAGRIESVPPEFRDGIGEDGAEGLAAFIEEGRTLIAFNRAAEFAVESLRLPVENAVKGLGRRDFFAPGTLLEVRADPSHPLSAGLRDRTAAWFEHGPVFRIGNRTDPGVRAVLSYPERNVLAAGWLLGASRLRSRAAVLDVRVGAGRVVLFGIKPQYRGQSNATFKLVFNALHL